MIVEKSSPPSNPEVQSTSSNGHVDRRLFDIVAAAEYLQSIGATGASSKFVYRLISDGELPHLKIGKRFFISKNSIDSWLLRHERRVR